MFFQEYNHIKIFFYSLQVGSNSIIVQMQQQFVEHLIGEKCSVTSIPCTYPQYLIMYVRNSN